MKVESERINKEIEIIKNKIEKDINVVGVRLEKVEKLFDKLELNFKESEDKIMKIKEKLGKVDVKKWVDPDCSAFNNLEYSGSKLTSKSNAWVFGSNKIVEQYIFTVTLSKINLIGLGLYDSINKNGNQNLNYVTYQSDCYCNVGGAVQKKGNGFKTGEKVTVTIDLK